MQLATGPYDYAHNSPLIRNVVDKLHPMNPSTYQSPNSQSEEEALSALTKVDMTRDVGGCFYAPADWKVKHQQLSSELTKLFDIPFRDNGNSMNSCF